MSNTNKYDIKYIHKADDRVIAIINSNTGAPLQAAVAVMERLIERELDQATTITLLCFVFNRLSVTINLRDDAVDITNTLERVGANVIRDAVDLVCSYKMSLAGMLHYMHLKRIVTVDELLDFQERGSGASENWKQNRCASVVYNLCFALNEACGREVISATSVWTGGVHGTVIDVLGVESWQAV